ncbi:hypothetical protein LWI28_014274 [Acer negundo]|uniref:non-specific serine/threonine protein kinase n=1 Tax=Acer negundo TaxID=4023 RepID=A0AAD5J5J9_ACENE|nr:hypothetical protein LWI28_014274 [Acer negundo]
MFLHRFLLLSLEALVLLNTCAFGATLPNDEVEALREIAKTIGKRDWNFSVDPCSGKWGWATLNPVKGSENAVTCNCSFANATLCHVVSIVLEFNQLSGSLPPELGNLPSLERFLISSNNFSGALPATFAKLTTMKDLRISDNRFSGQIPNFIQNWTKLEKLVVQASGLVGPIPSGIAALEKLSDLRISELNGTEATFPSLVGMKKMKILILRSCNIIGKLPEYLGQMTTLKTLMLTFTLHFSSGAIVSCLRSFKCPKTYYSLHINCGGKEVMANGNTTFEDDTVDARPSKFVLSRSNWASSTTGHFLDDDRPSETYIWTNSSRLLMNDSQLYMQARLSPISLTYYGFCMGNGNYSVNLHFAEIMFSDDKTYYSFGRRIFDVYVQGKLVLKDFNIEDEAGGAAKAIIKNFTVAVTNNTLEIRLFWAGKGTVGIPFRGVYGPLVSAISVTPNFIPPSENKSSSSSSVSVGTVLGIVAAAVFLIILVFGILWWKGCLRPKSKMELDLKGLDLHTGSFTLRQIKAATNSFDPANKIGEGGFGPVYKGVLADGSVIAVKQLSSKSKQGNREFVNEIGMISALQHPHLVKLYGCCIEGNQLLLVYEYLENNSLARALFGPEEHQLNLDWPTRHKICVGIARGLAYLHEESRLKIVHRDIKATNVLLDKDLKPKISDFGLAKLDEEDNTHISTRVAGTFGYMAPEYAMRGYLTDKADVYSFGIVALEIVSGRSNTSYRQKEDAFYLLDWALILKDEGKLMELVDPKLDSNFNEEEVMVMINAALLCSDVSPTVRPSMSTVVSMLEGRAAVQDFVPDSIVSADEETKSEAIRKYYQFNREQGMNKNQSQTQSQSISMDGPWTASSTSAGDLYPVNLDSDYFKGRD